MRGRMVLVALVAAAAAAWSPASFARDVTTTQALGAPASPALDALERWTIAESSATLVPGAGGLTYGDVESLRDRMVLYTSTEILSAHGNRGYSTADWLHLLTPTDVAVGDFDGDGKVDIAATTLPYFSRSGDLVFYLGRGDGTFEPPLLCELGGDTACLAWAGGTMAVGVDRPIHTEGVEDYDPPTTFHLYLLRTEELTALLRSPPGTPVPVRSVQLDDPPISVAVGSFSAEVPPAEDPDCPPAEKPHGKPLGVAALTRDGAVVVITAEGVVVEFLSPSPGLSSPPVVGPRSLAAGLGNFVEDTDGSGTVDPGDPDCVEADDDLFVLGWFPQRRFGALDNQLHTDGSFTYEPFEYPYTGPAPIAVAVADMDADGRPDLVVLDQGDGAGGSISVLLAGPPGQGFLPPLATPVGECVFDERGNLIDCVIALAVLDADGDAFPDVVVSGSTQDTLFVPGTGNRPDVTYVVRRGTLTFLHGDGAGGFSPGAIVTGVGRPVKGPFNPAISLTTGRVDPRSTTDDVVLASWADPRNAPSEDYGYLGGVILLSAVEGYNVVRPPNEAGGPTPGFEALAAEVLAKFSLLPGSLASRQQKEHVALGRAIAAVLRPSTSLAADVAASETLARGLATRFAKDARIIATLGGLLDRLTAGVRGERDRFEDEVACLPPSRAQSKSRSALRSADAVLVRAGKTGKLARRASLILRVLQKIAKGRTFATSAPECVAADVDGRAFVADTIDFTYVPDTGQGAALTLTASGNRPGAAAGGNARTEIRLACARLDPSGTTNVVYQPGSTGGCAAHVVESGLRGDGTSGTVAIVLDDRDARVVSGTFEFSAYEVNTHRVTAVTAGRFHLKY